MNITFLIGNGFDLNLGLNTRYSDFLAVYKTIREEDSNFIQFMKKRINEDSILWSDAELALGDSTKYLIGDDEKTRFDAVEAFSNFHIDICMRLASYLEEQQSRLPSFDNPEEIAKKMAICLNGFANGFREESRNMIQNSYITAKGGINLMLSAKHFRIFYPWY